MSSRRGRSKVTKQIYSQSYEKLIRGTEYNKNSEEARKLDRAVAEFICMDQVPVYTIENHGFQQML